MSAPQLLDRDPRGCRRPAPAPMHACSALPHRRVIASRLLPALVACACAVFAGVAAAGGPRDSWENKRHVRRFALSPDGKTLALLVKENSKDSGVELWDVATKKLVGTLTPDAGEMGHFLAFTSDGKTLVVSGSVLQQKMVTELVPINGRLTPVRRVVPVEYAAVTVWDVASQKLTRTLVGVGGGEMLTPDGKSLIVESENGLVLCDLATGEQTKAIDAGVSSAELKAHVISSDGKTLALGTKDGAIVVYDMEKEKVRHTLRPEVLPPPGQEALADPPRKAGAVELLGFSPDGKTLASYGGSGWKVDLWDIATGKNIDFLRPAPWCIGNIHSLAFSPDGKTLAFGGATDGSAVQLWDLAAGGFRADFDGSSPKGSFVEFLAFSADGKTLVAAGDYKPIDFWDVPAGKPKDVKPFELTPEQKKALEKP